MLKFTKMNGAGNDFVLVDNRDGKLQLSRETIARLCDRHRGIGADGLLAVESAKPPQNESGENGADFQMRYYNSDGGEAEMCGNGARCFARFAQRLSEKSGAISFETLAGKITAQFVGEQIRLAMSEPRDLRLDEQLALKLETARVHSVNTGVPHAVVFVEDLENVAVARLGAEIRFHEHFAPRGTNVNFAKQLDAQNIAIRTYERGVEAETLACGTGVVASALIFHKLKNAPAPIGVRVRGGERLEVSFEKTGDGIFKNVTLTGPADFVFEGEIEI